MKPQYICAGNFPQYPRAINPTRGLAVLVISITALATPAMVGAVNRINLSGLSASANFSSTDGCIYTYAYVSASTEVNRQTSDQTQTTTTGFLTVSKSDVCQYLPLLEGNGSSTLGDADFQVGKRLDTATLKTTITVYDWVSDSYFDIDVDLTWTATGDAGRSMVIEHDAQAGLIFQQKMTGTGRIADAAGTVSDGTTNFSPEPTQEGYIQNVSTGSVTIFKPNGIP